MDICMDRWLLFKLQWRHNGCDSVSNHQPHDRLLRDRLLRVTGLCAGNSAVTCKFPAQIASNAEMFPFDNVIMTNNNMPGQKGPSQFQWIIHAEAA